MITNKNVMKAFKILHLLSAISVIGGFLCIFAILIQKHSGLQLGAEAAYDQIMLAIFNTAITYGAILLAMTIAIYSLFTTWGVVKYRFIIIKWILMISIFLVAWFLIGSALSGMTSISDAGYQADLMKSKYQFYENEALLGIIIELVMSVVVVILSVYKPFGKRNTKEFKHRKLVLAILIPCIIIGITVIIQSEIRHIYLRNTPIEDVDVSQIKDGIYEGQSTFGSYTYHVQVTIAQHKITNIQDIAPRNSIYVQYATGVFSRIIDRQTPNVDAISGATTTSKAFMKAVENALK